ncbi:MAG: 3-oxoacyl-[acyl-carrier protein] reductase [Gammaproteobacteria bacterium]|nr:3-oxoacyl-[acyl-carrier protein] reductase [Gammaproteobacteria bacterium]
MIRATRVAIVTGASGGIGGKVIRRLAADGFATVLGYAGNKEVADQTVDDIQAVGAPVRAVRANVTVNSEVARLFDQALDAFGRIDAVVHCAGITPLSLISKGDLECFDRVIAVNLRGAFIVLSQAAEHVANGGRIIAFSSSVLGLSPPTYGPYIASKAGVEGLVRVLARELRGRSISVNTVAPGPVPTDAYFQGVPEVQIESLRRQPPLERLGRPEDIASMVSFLCSADGAWVNGQLLRVNGGLT